MTDPDLHPLPITPNDPLSIVSMTFASFLILAVQQQEPVRVASK